MEVAGLVLGALPLAIQAIQTYRTILISFENTESDLKSMASDLTTEVRILQNTIEMLLRGIASDFEIGIMIGNPYDVAWSKYEDEVRLRLWGSRSSFLDLVEDMMKAAAELQERLAINDQGKTRLTDRVSIWTELKLKTSFTLRKDEYAKILDRLHNGNANLHALVQQSNYLEPSRRPSAQAKAAGLIRRLSAGIFYALQGAITCGCIGSHDIGLAIPQRSPVLLPDDKEEDAARALDFDVVFSTHGETPQRWDTMRVKQAEKEIISHSPIFSPASPEPPRKKLKLPSSIFNGLKKKDSTSLSTKAPLSPSTNCVSNTALPRPQITNLCQSLRKGKGVPSVSYGFINDRLDKFDVYHSDRAPLGCGVITLRDILDGKGESAPNFEYPERLRLALALSFGVFHLYNTPWLAKVLSLDDIVFLYGGSTIGQGPCYMDRPILAKPISGASQQSVTASLTTAPVQQQTIRTNTCRPIDPTLLSHGLLLIQIITGTYSAQLRIEDGMTLDDILERQTIASETAGMVLANGGMNYAGAVRWCLENFLATGYLDNAELARQFHEAVISRLETDMKIQSTKAF